MAIKCHHSFPKGKRLYIIMRNGDIIIDKYVKYDKGILYLENHELKYKHIRSTGIYNKQLAERVEQ
jgi:hypothetical protein